MKKIIENANVVFEKVNGGFIVIKSRHGDLVEEKVYTENFVSHYIRENSAVII